MFELIQLGEKTYLIDAPAKMGIFQLNDHEISLIDSGNDKDAGKKIQNILAGKSWSLKFILNTHSNADHIGGNALLQQRLGAPAFSSGIESCFNRYPILEPAFLYGGFPAKPLRNKFLMAQPSQTEDLALQNLPAGMEIISLDGHFFGMIGVHTEDEVWFLADCLMGENILDKYHISFIFDVDAYLKTLVKVEQLEGRWFVPAHAQACQDIRPLVAANRRKVYEICERILKLCNHPVTFEAILKQLFDDYQLTMDWNQYVLVGSTIRSFLAYLLDQSQLEADFCENRLVWSTLRS